MFLRVTRLGVRFFAFVLFCSELVAAQSNQLLQLLAGVKYSYGVVAPVGWTVGAYIWYIGVLGLILGALLLLHVSKSWKDQTLGFGFFDRSYHFQRAFGDGGLFDKLDKTQGNLADHQLFWTDRIRKIAEKLTENR
ncbi:uncharacterized protein LOC129722401 [Wyeomyia smithii]|uniref:uncharacterized protein LOC129722401 n=1 Tax=Wyeomyia smithii TaxID=174621 RepID=UPI002467C9D0|nr:uncharacterized protein LOC129722401 [Wyeomyia smithii]